jgi:hypothetical protein
MKDRRCSAAPAVDVVVEGEVEVVVVEGGDVEVVDVDVELGTVEEVDVVVGSVEVVVVVDGVEVVVVVLVDVEVVAVGGDVVVVTGPAEKSFVAGEKPRRADNMSGSLPSMPSAQIPIPANPSDVASCAAS